MQRVRRGGHGPYQSKANWESASDSNDTPSETGQPKLLAPNQRISIAPHLPSRAEIVANQSREKPTTHPRLARIGRKASLLILAAAAAVTATTMTTMGCIRFVSMRTGDAFGIRASTVGWRERESGCKRYGNNAQTRVVPPLFVLIRFGDAREASGDQLCCRDQS